MKETRMKINVINAILISILMATLAGVSGCSGGTSGNVSASYYYNDPYYPHRYPYYNRDVIVVLPPPGVGRPRPPTTLPSRPLPGPGGRLRR